MFGITINRVKGDSMSPLIPHGSYIIFKCFFIRKWLKSGDLVKVLHPKYGTIIKSILYKDSSGFYWLVGENEQSVTTVEMGAITPKMIIGKSVCKINRHG